jgi:membrane glycosyltransferase
MNVKPKFNLQLDQPSELLGMPDQDFAHPFLDPAAPCTKAPRLSTRQLFVIFLPAIASLTLAAVLFSSVDASSPFPMTVVLAIVATIIPFYWDAVASLLAVLGLVWKPSSLSKKNHGLGIAVLVLLYDESPEPVMERAALLLEKLVASKGHSFSLHVLSDSRHSSSVLREKAVHQVLRRRHPTLEISYRHRPQNVDYKSGNIRDWIRSEGHVHDAMLVLDADSTMSADSVLQLANALAGDASCGLVQSVPQVLAGQTIWQNMQAHASHVVGTNLGMGLAAFSGEAANYYGHNALLRIKAFAAAAGLPHMKGDAPFGGVIMSHDFVEAALLCRAGWSVRLMPEASQSFEDTPATLSGFLARDRRWCHGNMQHVLLLRMPGLHFISRFHLLQGAMTYLNAPLWLLAMIMWMIVPGVEFGAALIMVLATLMLPRLIGLWRFRGSYSLACAGRELLVSSLLAPSLIIQRTRMILAIFLGRTRGWSKSASTQMAFIALLKFHAIEVVAGACLSFLIAKEAIALWLVPIALSLIFAPLLALLISRQKTE